MPEAIRTEQPFFSVSLSLIAREIVSGSILTLSPGSLEGRAVKLYARKRYLWMGDLQGNEPRLLERLGE
jgi:hypothetical protein